MICLKGLWRARTLSGRKQQRIEIKYLVVCVVRLTEWTKSADLQSFSHHVDKELLCIVCDVELFEIDFKIVFKKIIINKIHVLKSIEYTSEFGYCEFLDIFNYM